MNLNEREQTVKSIMGSVCSILLLAVVVLYAYQKTEILVNKKNVDILTEIYEKELTYDDTFSYQNGLNVAVAFTSYDSETEWILDPSYGELVFKHFAWGPNPDGSYFTKREQKKSHICSREELGLTEDVEKSKFMPLVSSDRGFVDAYQKKFICLDEEDLFLYGDYNSLIASQINI